MRVIYDSFDQGIPLRCILGRRSDNPSSDGQQGYGPQQGYGSQQFSAGQSAGGYQQPAAPKPAPAPSIPADDPDDLPF